MKPVTPREFLDQWEEIVRTSLFPVAVLEERKPDLLLDEWGKDLPNHRKRLRHEADALVIRILNTRSDPDIDEILSSIPLELLGIYYDRVTRAAGLLREAAHLEPEYLRKHYRTWKDISKDLLLGKLVLPGTVFRFDWP